MPSRRSYLAALALGLGLAGCSEPSESGPETGTDDPAGSPTDGPSPTPSPSPSATSRPTDTPPQVEPLPVDDPAVDWAVRTDRPVQQQLTPFPGIGRLYVAAGEPQIGTPTDGTRSDGALLSLSTADGTLEWARVPDRPVVGRPVVHDRRVHVAVGYSSGYDGRDQSVLAFDHGGDFEWATTPRDAWLTVVGTREGSLFVGTGDDARGLDGEDLFAVGEGGAVRWLSDAGDTDGGRVVGDTLVHLAGRRAVTGYATADGERRWRVRERPVLAPTEAVAALRTRDCRLTFTTPDAEGDAPLVARAAADGTSQWRYGPRGFVPVGVTDASELFAPVDRPPAVVVTGADGTVAALRADGTVDWTFAVDTPPAGVPVAGRLVYVPDGAGTVYALTAGGTERWRVSLPARPRLSPLADGVLARSHRDGRHTLVSLRRDGTERWRHRTTAAITPPAVAGTRVFLGRADGTVLALSGE